MSDYGNDLFGSADRYYAARPERAGVVPYTPKHVDMIDRLIDRDIEDLVERVRREWNSAIREQLRNATGLKLSVADRRIAVPVRVVAGLPDPLAEIVLQHDAELLWWLTLQYALLAKTADGLAALRPWLDEIKKALKWPIDALPDDPSVEATERLIRAALDWQRESQLVEKIGAIETDILGAYFFRVPVIDLYWQAIGLVAAILGVSVEHLTMIVLTHELAHAYTHLGLDIDGTTWETEAFAQADIHIVEGLAQFYTRMVCTVLDRRWYGLLPAFESLLERQSTPYTCFTGWTDDHDRTGEIVRYTAINCRARGTRIYEDFLKQLADTKKNLPAIRGGMTISAGQGGC